MRAMVWPSALEGWQEGVVYVDHMVGVPRAEVVAEDLQAATADHLGTDRLRMTETVSGSARGR